MIGCKVQLTCLQHLAGQAQPFVAWLQKEKAFTPITFFKASTSFGSVARRAFWQGGRPRCRPQKCRQAKAHGESPWPFCHTHYGRRLRTDRRGSSRLAHRGIGSLPWTPDCPHVLLVIAIAFSRPLPPRHAMLTHGTRRSSVKKLVRLCGLWYVLPRPNAVTASLEESGKASSLRPALCKAIAAMSCAFTIQKWEVPTAVILAGWGPLSRQRTGCHHEPLDSPAGVSDEGEGGIHSVDGA